MEFHDPTLGIGKVFGQESNFGSPSSDGLSKIGRHLILVIKWFKN